MSRIASAVLALFALSATTFLRAAVAKDAEPAKPLQLYDGTVGPAAIVLAIERDGDSVSGRYFYRSQRFNITLDGEAKGGAIKLQSQATGDKLELKPSGSGYEGKLTTAKGKTLPVQLRLLGADAPSGLPADLPGDLDLYEKTRLSGLTLKAEKRETVDGKEIGWQIEPVSRIRLFRIESGYPEPVMGAVNKALAQIQWRNVSQYFDCPNGDGGAGMQTSQEGAPYFSDAYVSFAFMSAWDCAGAAHPDAGIEGHSFNARTGKEIELDDVLKFGKAAPPAKDSDPWYSYRSNTFAPALVALLERLHPKEMRKPKKEDGCDYTDKEVWNFPSWRLTEKGLYVGASFARYARACDNPDWSVIPYADLDKQPH